VMNPCTTPRGPRFGGCTAGGLEGLRRFLGDVMPLDLSPVPTGAGAVRTPRRTPTWRSTCEVSSVVGSYVTRVTAARSRPTGTAALIVWQHEFEGPAPSPGVSARGVTDGR